MILFIRVAMVLVSLHSNRNFNYNTYNMYLQNSCKSYYANGINPWYPGPVAYLAYEASRSSAVTELIAIYLDLLTRSEERNKS